MGEMVWKHLHDEEAPNVGDDFDSAAEMHGEAPLCERCGDEQAARKVDGRDLCSDCIEGLRL